MQRPTLNIIGAGRLGQTLGRLFHRHQCFQINAICNRSQASSEQAIDFIGAGSASPSIGQLPDADVIMITTPDTIIQQTIFALKETPALKKAKVIFHCSGATASTVLAPLKSEVTSVASIHPNMTFANPAVSVEHFTGTYCAFEGDDAAFDLLSSAFNDIGGQLFRVSAENKSLYHAAAVMSCNYLVALMETATQMYVEAGVNKDVALKIMRPIVNQTVQNIFDLGTVEALTGPVARGDVQTIQSHLANIKQAELAALYKHLGLQLIDLACAKRQAEPVNLSRIKALLSISNSGENNDEFRRKIEPNK